MDIDEIEELLDAADRDLVLRNLRGILDVLDKAEEERLRRNGVIREGDYGMHIAAYGHRLSAGCCARAWSEGRPSILDDPEWNTKLRPEQGTEKS